MKEPEARYGTTRAIDAIAKKLNLPNEEWMQDWAYIVAEADQLKSYIELYDHSTDDDEKFVLMKMIIQAADEKKREDQLLDDDWQSIEQRLRSNFVLHEYTIFYWSLLKEDLEYCFHITPKIRSLWMNP